jgi:WD40 repeat protein
VNTKLLLEQLSSIKNNAIIGEHIDCITYMILLPNGYIASASSDKTVKIWNFEKNILIKTLEGHTEGVSCLALLQDGKIASSAHDKTVKIWDCGNNHKSINTLYGLIVSVRNLLVLKNGNLISGDVIGICKVWDHKTYE